MAVFSVGSLTFKSKGEARAYFQDILARNRIGCRLISTDEINVVWLLDRHPERDVKIGTGVASITIALDGWGKKHFVARRKDGTDMDFSYLACFHPPSPRAQLMQALRQTITPDIAAARERYLARLSGPLLCGETGEALSRADAHLDHRLPFTFAYLVECFLVGRATPAIAASEGYDAGVYRLEDTEVAADWREFHNSLAKLDFVHRRVNLGKKRTNFATPHIVLREWL